MKTKTLTLLFSLALFTGLAGCATTTGTAGKVRTGSPLNQEYPTTWITEADQAPILQSGKAPSQPIGEAFASGFAKLTFTVTAEGKTENIRVVDSEGSRYFGGNSREAIKYWRYTPAMKDGQPVACDGEITFNFTGATRGARPQN